MGRNGCAGCGNEPVALYWVNGNGERVDLGVENNSTEIPAVDATAVLCAPLQFRCVEDPATGEFSVAIYNPQTGGSIALGSAF